MFDQEGDVDRSDWATKSGAAARREAKAMAIVEKALLAATSFPATVDIPCDVHLTNECWKSFSHFVKEKGGKAKRRQATIQERLASGDKRSSKMYVITVTLQKQTVSNMVAAAAAPAGASSSIVGSVSQQQKPPVQPEIEEPPLCRAFRCPNPLLGAPLLTLLAVKDLSTEYSACAY